MKSNHYLRLIMLAVVVFVISFSVANQVFAQLNPPTGFTPSVNTNSTVLTPCDPGVEDCYTLLEPLPNADGTPLTGIDTSATGGKGLGGFINFIFEIGVGVAGVLGIVMLTIYGFQYAAEDKNVATFSTLKTKITGVVLGLLLLLGIFVILRTINPDLLIVEPSIKKVTFDLEEGQDISTLLESSTNTTINQIYAPIKGHMRDGGTLRPATSAARQQMVNSISPNSLMDLRAAGVTIKSGAGTKVIKDVGTKIVSFNNALKQKNVPIVVTEAFKPTTYTHYAACQYTGTCVDADILGGFNAQKLVILVSEANRHGLIAVWETKSASDYKEAVAAGVPRSNILLFKGHITGDHFSLYDYK